MPPKDWVNHDYSEHKQKSDSTTGLFPMLSGLSTGALGIILNLATYNNIVEHHAPLDMVQGGTFIVGLGLMTVGAVCLLYSHHVRSGN